MIPLSTMSTAPSAYAAHPAIPARSIISMNGAALPSMIGTSGPSNSTTALSTWLPASAAIRCSIVPI